MSYVSQFFERLFSMFFPLKNEPVQPPVPPTPPVKPPPPVVVTSSSGAVVGVDVSHYEPTIDWAALKIAGVKFMYAKATEGAGYKDPMFKKHMEGAKAAGILCGAYHFFHHDEDVATQAANFTSTLGSVAYDLVPAFDWEQQGGGAGQVQSAMNWLNMVEVSCKKVPIIYGSPSFLNDLKLPASFGRYPLWVANYGVLKPSIPHPWSKYTIWQESDRAVFVGALGGHTVDKDIFNGSLDDLKAQLT